MDKQSKSLLTGLIITIGVIGVFLILLLTISGTIDERKEISSEAVAKKTETELPTENLEELTELSTEDRAVDNAQMDYNKSIRETSENADKLLVIDGKEYSIPCQFKDIKNDFDFVEELPETYSSGAFQEIHTKKQDSDTGISFMLINISHSDVPTDEAYLSNIVLTKGVSDATCLGLSIGSSMADIKECIEGSGYEYSVSEYDYEQYFMVEVSDMIHLMITYDRDEQCVTKILLEYVII